LTRRQASSLAACPSRKGKVEGRLDCLRVAVSAPAPLAGAAIDLGAQAIPARPPLPGEQFQVRARDQRLTSPARVARGSDRSISLHRCVAERRHRVTVYGYARVSTERQADEGVSLDEQIRRIEGRALEQGWQLAAT